MKEKIFIFDVGGTLLTNNDLSFERALKYLYDEIFDVKESFDDFLEVINNMDYVRFNRDVTKLEISFSSIFNYLNVIYEVKSKLSFDEIEKNFAHSFYTVQIKEGVIEFLDYLKNKNIILWVLSNSMFSTNQIKNELREIGVLDYFDYVVSSGDHLYRKPSLELFKMYLKKADIIGVKNYEVAYLGNDFRCDIESPVKLGMSSYFISKDNYYHDGTYEFSDYKLLMKELEK